MIRLLVLAVRTISYLALAVVAAGLAAVVFVSVTGVCPNFDEGAVQCASPVYEQIGGIGLFVLLASAFTVLPAMFAVAGALFLVRDLRSALRGRREAVSRNRNEPP